MHPSSYEQMRIARDLHIPGDVQRGDVIEIGGVRGGRTYRDLFPVALSYRIADIAGACELPMPSDYVIPAKAPVDLVLSGQVLEHVRNPFRMFEAVRAVLRPGGYAVHIAPSKGAWHDTIDCWRFARDSFRVLAEDTGFEIVADWIYDGDAGRGKGSLGDHVFVGRRPE